MKKYSERPMDLADATIVVIAAALKTRTIFTLDKKDFSIYRPKHCRHFEIIPEYYLTINKKLNRSLPQMDADRRR